MVESPNSFESPRLRAVLAASLVAEVIPSGLAKNSCLI